MALASYNGGHCTFFPAVVKGLREAGSHAKVVGGGGSTIVPDDVKQIESAGASKIFGTDFSLSQVSELVHGIAKQSREEAYAKDLKDLPSLVVQAREGKSNAIAKLLSMVEDADFIDGKASNMTERKAALASLTLGREKTGKVVFITGVGGAGKSTVTDEITRRFIADNPGKRCAVIAIDPTMNDNSALLGDRIRMNNIYHSNVFMRSMATRIPFGYLPASLNDAISVLRAANFDLIVLESPGTGQAGIDYSLYNPDLTVHVKTKEFGTANIQLQKDQLLRSSDITVLNKIDREGSEATFKAISKIVRQMGSIEKDGEGKRVVFPTQAKLPGDLGVQALYSHMMGRLGFGPKTAETGLSPQQVTDIFSAASRSAVVPHSRRTYLAQVTQAVKSYDSWTEKQLEAMNTQGLDGLDVKAKELLANWEEKWNVTLKKAGSEPTYTSFNGVRVPKVSFPHPRHKLESLRFLLQEGLPGEFPFHNGVFPLRKDSGAETTRQFAGLRMAEHTNERFKLLSQGVAAPRLSTAFDGITLYGDDSGDDKGSLGKIGEGGVAIDSLDDMKILYNGFDFSKEISTSLTINGCAVQMLALFFNAVIDSNVEIYRTANPAAFDSSRCDPNLVLTPEQLFALTVEDVHPNYGIRVGVLNKIKTATFKSLRGTVQSDILKEIQAQNECLYQMDFSIRLMADVQQFFIDKNIQKFYSVSISGYHIGEAGATPLQEMAFTTANGFTYLENYLARGMKVDDICRNFSFFFRDSNEIEWLALGPVLRKIWAIAIRDVYNGNSRSQQFKYHTQTSGRALQVAEWDTLNPLRQTYQALIALLGGTNSLHVDSADEPLTTPSEKFVRQATMIPNYLTLEVELLKQQNLLSGSYAFRDLCAAVQEGVLAEFMRLDDQGGVCAAMELDYQRACISEASMNYEIDIWNGRRPIIGRNTAHNPDVKAMELSIVRPTSEDFVKQMARTESFKARNEKVRDAYLARLRSTIKRNGNVFEELMTTMRYCTLGQTSRLLAHEGGRFSQTI